MKVTKLKSTEVAQMKRNRVTAESYTNSQIPKEEGIAMTSRKFSRKRIGQALGLLVLGLTLLVTAYSVTATNGAHPDSETPGSENLFIFSPIYDSGLQKDIREEIVEVARRAIDHNYRPLYYLNEAGENPELPGYKKGDKIEEPTASNFKAILADEVKGILFVTSHGLKGGLLVEALPMASEQDCKNRVNDYVSNRVFDAGELDCGNYVYSQVGNRQILRWGIIIKKDAIRRYFRDSETIVHISACNSWALRDAFENVRDFFGFDGTCPTDRALEATKLLWGRLHGEEGQGTQRPATVAGAGLPNGLRHHHRANTLDTVLSPAVKQHEPPKDKEFVVPVNVKGKVIFDTKMDWTVDPAAVITVAGCDARILNPTWTKVLDPKGVISAFILDFALELNTEGEATLTVHQDQARAERDFQNNLDGNQNPAGKDHIGPNRDDFVWKVKCVKKSGTSFSFTVPVGTGGSCKAKTPELGSIQISEIWATVTNCKTGQPLPQGTPVTFTVNLKPGKEKAEHISDIESITVSAPDFEATTVQGPFTAIKVSIPGPSPITIQVINLGTVCLKPK
jgi:hypothetical protein